MDPYLAITCAVDIELLGNNSSNDPGEGGDDSSRMHQRNSSSGGSIAGLLRLDGTKALDLFVNAPQSTNTMGSTFSIGTGATSSIRFKRASIDGGSTRCNPKP